VVIVLVDWVPDAAHVSAESLMIRVLRTASEFDPSFMPVPTNQHSPLAPVLGTAFLARLRLKGHVSKQVLNRHELAALGTFHLNLAE